MLRTGADARQGIPGALALAGLLALCAPLSAAGRKASGATEITDDLTTGSAGSVRLQGGAFELDGSLGQTAAGEAFFAPIAAEAGYFSRRVAAPQTAFPAAVHFSSITIQWDPLENAPGTLYRVEMSTDFAFNGIVRSSETYGNSATVEGLRSGVFYWGRIRASYMEGDESGYNPVAGGGASTQLYCGSMFTVVASGNWSDPATWDRAFPPTRCARVFIDPGETVTVDVADAESSTITLSGTLKFSRSASSRLSMSGGELRVQPGGHLDMGSSADSIPSGLRAELILSTGSAGHRYGLIVQDGGDFTAYGAAKAPFSKLDAGDNIASGETSFTLAESPASLNWEVGDRLIVGPGEVSGTAAVEERGIQSIAGDVITVDAAFSGTFLGTAAVHVANLTRNVLVRSSGTDVSADTGFVRSLARNATSFDLSNAEFAYLGGGSGAGLELNGSPAGGRGRISSSTFRNGLRGIITNGVDGLRVERSIFYGNQLQGLDLANCSLSTAAYNHAAGNGWAGINARSGSFQLDVSSNVAYGNAQQGLNVDSTDGSEILYNELAANGFAGLRLANNANFNTLEGNLSRRNAEHGFLIDQGADENNFYGNRAASNTLAGIFVSTVSGSHFSGNESFRNGGGGLLLQGTTSNFFEFTDLYENEGPGLLLAQASTNYFVDTYSNGNEGPGLRLEDESNHNRFAGGVVAGNTGIEGNGVELDAVRNNRLIGLIVHGNDEFGLHSRLSAENVFDSGSLGYDETGADSSNLGAAEVSMGPAEGFGGFLELMHSRVFDTPEIEIDSINESTKAVISWNQDFATGTLRLWGHAVPEGDEIAFDYAFRMQGSTATAPVLLRGTGHLLEVCSTDDSLAVSQIVHVVREGTDWNVYGSSSGFITQNPPFSCTNFGQFGIAFSPGGMVNEGDRLAFALQAATPDQNFQKNILVGPAASSFNGGRSRIEIPSASTWTLRGGGAEGEETVMDRLDAGSPYYTFVSSGRFTAEHAEIRNLDPDGLHLSGPDARLFLSSSTFDELADDGAVNAYITASDMAPLTTAATFYGVRFGDSREVAASSVNVRVLGGAGAGPDWTFRRWAGVMGGEGRDDDGPGGEDRIKWSPFTPQTGAPSLLGIFESSATLQWLDTVNDLEEIRYELEASSFSSFVPLAGSSNTALTTATLSGLDANTTHYFQVSAVEVGRSTPLALGEFSTWAKPPNVLPTTFLDVGQTTATVAWAARPASPQAESAEGYVLEASSSPAFDPLVAVVLSSRTTNVALSALTVGLASELDRNTTHYFRVGSLNWVGAPNYASLGSTSTLAHPPSLPPEPFAGVFATSVAVQWTALAASPQRDSAEGYRLEASTAPDFTGMLLSSRTTNVALSTLTISGLTPYVTYYFRVGSLNWNGAESFGVTVATRPIQFIPMGIALAPPKGSFSAAWGDVDNDGDMDLAFGIDDGVEQSYGLRGAGGGTFSTFTVAGQDAARAVAWGDFDGDGDLDLAVARGDDVDTRILRNDGSSFSLAESLNPAADRNDARTVAWGDYDNDGDLDLAVGVDDGDDYIARNKGDGTFDRVDIISSGGGTFGMAWGDYDNDGDLDLAAAKDLGSTEQKYYRNDGGGVFAVVGLGLTHQGRGRGIAWGDLDNDGDLDLLVAMEDDDAVYYRNVGGAFDAGSRITGAGPGARAVALADYDGDGDIDAALARSGGRESLLLRNDGSGSFTVIPLVGTAAGEAQGIAWADFDGDGDLDLALARSNSLRDYVLINSSETVNQRPEKVATFNIADFSLAYDASGSTLTVRWDASDYDAEGASATVTYAVAAATVNIVHPGGDELRLTTGNQGFVVPPQFGSPLLGNYLRPAYDEGTDTHKVSFRLDLPHSRLKSDTTYYFAIQAVDLGLRRSSWTVSGSTFVFAGVPPQDRTIDEVFQSSLTVTYGLVSGATAYLLEASTAPDFTGDLHKSSASADAAAALLPPFLPAESLSVNTTYYLRMGALYRQTTSYALTVPDSTATLAAAPAAAAVPFASVSSGSLVVSWGRGSNPLGTRYQAFASTGGLSFSFSATTVSYAAEPSAAFSGLQPNTTYFLTVQAVNHNGVPSEPHVIGSTITRIETPTDLLLEHRSSTTITVSVYAPTPAFHNLDKGRSGTRVNRDAGLELSGWKGSTWTYRREMPGGVRRELAAAAAGGYIYVFGGRAGSPLDLHERYDPESDEWAAVRSLPSPPRERLAGASLDGSIYALGGFNADFLPDADRYDPGSDDWTSLANVSQRRGLMAAAADGKVYAIGGDDGSASMSSTVEAFDPGNGNWGAAAGLLPARRDGAAAAHGEKIYVLGGHDGTNHLKDSQVFDPGTGLWASLNPMPTARSEAAAAVSGGKIFVFGGSAAGGRVAWVEEYDPAEDAWISRVPMNSTRAFAAAAGLNGRIFVFGGRDGADLSSVEEFDPGVVHRFEDLQPNSFHTFTAQARGSDGTETLESGSLNARTLAAVPSTATPTFVGVFAASVTVQWTSNNNSVNTNYRAQASTDAGFNGDIFTSDWEVGFSTNVAGLDGNRLYHFRVQARNGDLIETDFRSLGSTVTAVNPPILPRAAQVESSSITFQWDDNGNGAGTLYGVEISSLGFPSLLASSETVATSLVFGAGGEPPVLDANTTYYLRVRAFNSGGTPTGYTATVTTVTQVNMPAPHAVSSYTSVGVFVLTAQWGANGNASDTDYVAEISTDGYSTINVSSKTRDTQATFGLGGEGPNLVANTTYTVRVRALNRAGSSTANLDLGVKATYAAPPGAASPPFAGVGDRAITFDWVDSVNPPGTEYVARISTDDFETVNVASQTLNTQAAFGQGGEGADLEPNTTHFFAVHSVNRDGVATSTISASTITLPSQPAGDAFIVGISSIEVSWSLNGNPPGAEFEVEISSDGFGSFSQSSFTRTTSVLFGTGGELPALSPNTTHHFRITGIGWAGARGASLSAGPEVTLAKAPSSPSLDAVQLSSIAFSWSDNGNPAGETLYEAEISTDGFSTVNLASATRETSVVFGAGGAGDPLESNATYYLQVRAVNHAGVTTDYAVAAPTATPAAVPGSLQTPTVALDAVLLQWDHGGNRDGTRYRAEISNDGFSTVLDASSTANLSVLFGNGGHGGPLSPNTTYHFQVYAVDLQGRDVGPSAEVSTVTLVAQPQVLSPPFLTTDVSSITFHWDDGGNPSDTLYHAEISSDNFVLFAQSSFTRDTAALFGTGGEAPPLERNTTYYFRVSALNRIGVPTTPTTAQSTMTLVEIPLVPADPFPRVDFNAVRFEWSDNGNPQGTVYRVDMSTDLNFNPVDRSSVTLSTSALFGKNGEGANLSALTTYYFRAQAFNGRGVPTPFTVTRDTVTPPGDLIPPTIVNNQPGDDVWRRVNDGVYDVDLFDTGGADLDKLQVRASTMPGGSGPNLMESSNVVTNILADSYTTDWAFPSGVFDLLMDEATNYITVIALDDAVPANSATVVDVFYVRKDTTAPSFVNGEAGGDLAARKAAGTLYDVDVLDPGSGIAAFQYSASTQAGTGNQAVIPWTTIALPGGGLAYTADWEVDWNSLVPNATNYISVRAWDVAGTTSAVVDAFFVLKDTEAPTVGIFVPASPARSQLATISGTAADSLNVQGTELKFKEVGANHWDGAGFTSASEVWFTAAGTTDWSLSPGIPWENGKRYDVVARASDTAGQFSTPYSTSSFLFDDATPEAGVADPLPDSTISSLPQISGSAFDPDPDGTGPLEASGLADVEVRLRRISDDLWWNWDNETWGLAVSTTAAIGAPNWAVVPTELLKANLADQASYFVTISASDNAEPRNKDPFELIGSTFTFLDPGPPSAVTNLSALQGPSPGEISLSWTAPGDDGADGIILLGRYRIQHSTEPVNVVFSTTDAQVEIPTATVRPGETHGYLLSSLSAGVTHYLRIWTEDDAGNWSPVSNGATVQATPQPSDRIEGHVMKVSSEGITAVLVEAYDTNGILVSSTFTVADGSGTYSLGGLTGATTYRVQATWTADEVSSSVWLDGIPVGRTGVDFILEIDYTLSTLQGTLQTLAGDGSGGTSSAFLAQASADQFQGSAIELYQKDRLVATAKVGPDGRWTISNLLPGKYAVRAFNGYEYTQLQQIALGEGEVREVGFVFDPLPEEAVFAFPNPARDAVTFRFVSALAPLEAQILVFDIAGTLVRDISGSELLSPSPGLYHARWDLTNGRGEDVASGVYLFLVKVKGANGQNAKVIKKLAVVR